MNREGVLAVQLKKPAIGAREDETSPTLADDNLKHFNSIREKWLQAEQIAAISNSPTSPFNKRASAETSQILQTAEQVSAIASAGNLAAESNQSIEYVEAILVEALANFKGGEEGQLSLSKGERLYVLEWDYGNGWSFGENAAGEAGVFPKTYVREVKE